MVEWKYPILFWIFGALAMWIIGASGGYLTRFGYPAGNAIIDGIVFAIPFALMGLVIGWKKGR